MNRESHFLKINTRKQIAKKAKRRWIPTSLTLLTLIGGGLILNHDNASANMLSSHQNPPTYKLINPATVSSPRYSLNPSRPNDQNLEGHISHLGRKIVQKGMNHETIHPQQETVTKSSNSNINDLGLYQSRRCNGIIFSRVSTPFSSIRVNHRIYLHSLPSLSDHHNLPYVNRGEFRILKAFNQYNNHSTYIRYLISFSHQNYYINGDPSHVSFVLPSTDYRYYQNRIDNILSISQNNKQFDQIRQSLESLNAQHVIDYHVYLSLYIDTFNIQQERHPIFLSNLVSKPSYTDTDVQPSTHVKATSQDSLASMILSEISLIESDCRKAAGADHKTINKLNALINNATDNNLKQIASGEVLTNNQLIKVLSHNTNDALNRIDNFASLKLVKNSLDFQMKMANSIKADAERILNNDVQNLILMS